MAGGRRDRKLGGVLITTPGAHDTMTKVTERIRNGIDTEQMFGTLDAITADPSLGRFQFRVANEWLDGAHNRSTIQTFYGAGHEQFAPRDLLQHARLAEQAGFDGIACSDHFQPWWPDGQSGHAWPWLGAVGASTGRIAPDEGTPTSHDIPPRSGRIDIQPTDATQGCPISASVTRRSTSKSRSGV